jgi:hypothetical protein
MVVVKGVGRKQAQYFAILHHSDDLIQHDAQFECVHMCSSQLRCCDVRPPKLLEWMGWVVVVEHEECTKGVM